MRSFKRLFCLFCILTLCFGGACSAPKAKEFSKSGMYITLTDAFAEGKYFNMTAYYEWEDEDVTVSAIKEDFSLLEEEGASASLSLEEYAKTLLKASELSAEIKTEGGLTYFTFEKTPYETTYLYYAVVFRAEDAYWLFQFACPKESAAEYTPQFLEWARSVRFE